ncbi:MAG: SRPBCC family protein [Deltaproteobacteria bacterium]|nr:SRPBCC family protein [Deltaproteobacteria bacterium]
MRDIVVEVSGSVRATLETTFDVFAPIDLRLILRGYGPLPAVASVEDQTGAWDAPGQTRTIRLSDGSGMREALTLVERPRHFAYVIDELTGPFRFLVRGMRGAWWFEPVPDGASGSTAAAQQTRARWRYAFEPRSRFTRPLAAFIVKVLWRRNMQRALALARAHAEAAEQSRARPAAGGDVPESVQH